MTVQPQKNTNRTRFVFVALTVLVLGLVIFNAFILTAPKSALKEKMGLSGAVVVQVKDPSGKVVSQTRNDTIYTVSYDMIGCVLWSVCGNIGGLYFAAGPTTVITTTATLTKPLIDNFWTGMILSGNTQSTGACTNQLSLNGLNSTIASVSHSIGTNQFQLSASWTYTGASQGIQSVCLVYATQNSQINQLVNTVLSTSTSLASENFATQTLTTGQSITIQWTFSF